MPNKNAIRLTGRTGFRKIGISLLDPYFMYSYFPEDTSYSVLLYGEL
jgi:hypothetical protein